MDQELKKKEDYTPDLDELELERYVCVEILREIFIPPALRLRKLGTTKEEVLRQRNG